MLLAFTQVRNCEWDEGLRGKCPIKKTPVLRFTHNRGKFPVLYAVSL